MAARHAVIYSRLGNYRMLPPGVGAQEGVGAEASPGPVPKSGVVALRNQSRHRGCLFSHLLRQPAIVRRASGQGERRPRARYAMGPTG